MFSDSMPEPIGERASNPEWLATDDSSEDSPKAPLPDLCHKCGRCCRSATTYNSYVKLQDMAANGNEEAIRFLEVFEPYESVEAARQVEPEQVAHVVDIVTNNPDMSLEELTFYHCRFVTPEGLCGIYETRPNCCRRAPMNGWSAMPPGCGFTGWQFEQREMHKRMIRNLKTSAYWMEQLSPDGVTHPTKPEVTLEALKARIDEKIQPWRRYGAAYW